MAQKNRQQKQAGGAGLKPFYLVLIVIAVVGVAYIAYAAMGGGGAAVTEPIELGDLDAQALYAQATPVTRGAADAPVQVMVFSDFTCPACQSFTQFAEPRLKDEFVDAGQVRFVYYDFPLLGAGHEHGFLAARAARCAGDQGRYWEYHDRLFARQSAWSFARSAPVDPFVDYAEELGLDGDAFETCLRSDRFADAVTANRLLGVNLGIRATPTIFVGSRQFHDWTDWDAFRVAILAEMPARNLATDTAR